MSDNILEGVALRIFDDWYGVQGRRRPVFLEEERQPGKFGWMEGFSPPYFPPETEHEVIERATLVASKCVLGSVIPLMLRAVGANIMVTVFDGGAPWCQALAKKGHLHLLEYSLNEAGQRKNLRSVLSHRSADFVAYLRELNAEMIEVGDGELEEELSGRAVVSFGAEAIEIGQKPMTPEVKRLTGFPYFIRRIDLGMAAAFDKAAERLFSDPSRTPVR